ncbi:MAG: hypothetical protein E2O88_08470 [Bacteroidetes bacterium]|nr:MAG: hypothetical protein E2O88_08470 [Bacteroidota bacterium]
MKTNKEEIDELIHQALSEDEAKFYDQLGEQSILEMVGGLFQGRLKWITALMMIIMTILFVIGVFSLVQFFKVEGLRLMMTWAGAFFLCMMAVALLKLFSWMQMDKNAILRELKRLELQVSMLNKRMEA